jgi:hypothetical protein
MARKPAEPRTTFYNDGVGLSIHPERLKRYRDVARLLFKYGRSDLPCCSFWWPPAADCGSCSTSSAAIDRRIGEDSGLRAES